MEKLKQSLSLIATVAVTISIYRTGFTMWNIVILVLFIGSLIGQWASMKKKAMIAQMTPEERAELERQQEELKNK